MQLKKATRQFLLYLIVGALATIVEWAVFYILDIRCGMHYTLSVALAFILSTFANWTFGRLILFHRTDAGLSKELISIYLTSIVGLLFNLLIMFILIEKIRLDEMISKIIATVLVFSWNFLIRKLVIYKI